MKKLLGAFLFALWLPMFAAAEDAILFDTLNPEEPSPLSRTELAAQDTILTLWRSDCAPCMRELPVLARLAHSHPERQLALISLQDKASTAHHLAPAVLPENIHVLLARGPDKTVLAALGDTRQILPYSVRLRPDGTVCHAHYGLMGTTLEPEWTRPCATH